MAGAFTLPQSKSILRLPSRSTRPARSRIGLAFHVRATSDVSETPSTSSSTSVTNKEPKPGSLSTTNITAPSKFQGSTAQALRSETHQTGAVLVASLPLLLRLGTGIFVSGYSVSLVSKDEIEADQYALEFSGYKVKETSKVGPRPTKPTEIYEFESCPFYRKVREMVAVLDIDVLFNPCPRNGTNFHPKVAKMGGKQQFPYMMDPNTGVSMYESNDIIKYLAGRYGDGSVPIMRPLGLLTGSIYTPAILPPEPLKVWVYEGSPFCKLVRKVLVELELPHVLTSCARGSPKRQILFKKAGHFQVPYLKDPNTGIEMFKSAEIIDYLRATYALS